MRSLPLAIAFILAATATTVTGFQVGPGGGGSPGGGGEPAVNWKFTHPEDGMECYSDVVCIGTGPVDSMGTNSVYSYDNQIAGGVYASELTLQVSVLVETDPGIDWVGTTWSQTGTYYATIMPALYSLNLGLLTLTGSGATGGEVNTLAQVGGGQGVLFSIVEP